MAVAEGIERRRGGIELSGLQVPPGGIALVRDGSNLVAVAGPSVAVCLWCPEAGVACLAHFARACVYDPGSATARYGNVGVPRAIELVREAVGDGVVEAQIFGGATCPGQDPSIASGNVDMARRVLSARGIRVVSEDVGGGKGRKIVFDGRSGHVAVVKVHQLREEDWSP